MTAAQVQRLSLQLHARFLLGTLPFLAPVAYLQLCLFGLSDRQITEHFSFLAWTWLALSILLIGVAPYWIILSATRKALADQPGDVPGARLTRILELPRALEWKASWLYVGSSLIWALVGALHMDLPGRSVFSVAALTALVTAGFAALAGVQYWMQFEAGLRPLALDEAHKYPRLKPVTPNGRTPRLSWYLPYVFFMFVLCTVMAFFIVSYSNYHALAGGLSGNLSEFMARMTWPSILLGAFLMLVAVVTAYQLGQRYRIASAALQASIDGLAGSTPKMPDWVGTDEFGDLAFGISAVFDRLTRLTQLLKQSANQLSASAEQLSGSTARQNETLSRQAAALQETEVTAQEIKQTSLLAAQKTETVLQMADRAEEISQTGSAAVEQSLSGLTDIRDSVSDMANRIKQLGERTRQIATITTAVKDLADQSNMLALNAAIEAVRSGEHGKGFSVVAREIRTLADQSIQATNRVREILQDISDAIRSTVAITERGSERVQSSLVQVQSSGESLRALSNIVRDNAAAVRQIAAAVGQQNTGITEIFEAVKDLSRMMDETLLRVQSSDEAAERVRDVATEVATVVSQYGTRDEELRPITADVAAEAA